MPSRAIGMRQLPIITMAVPISAEDAILEMDMAGVDMALAWQNPATTVYSGGPAANTGALTQANRYMLDSALRYPDRFIPAGWVDA